ncbi:cytochrome c oxidase subunit II [Oxynema aestuarii]|uniref:Cytochrome c oxidase subunit 2 n=1 Tax=Oxynema aestuarii AP17 TaxID=2064643 RepID=A0A6H1TT04_9CYAN|nr:cytochrome c oxidase subunit II [Oxynema aestuarii]QIZ69738.1 cytochrome c oxidase subunit II [Oxynema aestuarii AP17]RMH78468.1 MAG: cytochrome c oxidase subunit II [Cyanobacteria bacterium J007]
MNIPSSIVTMLAGIILTIVSYWFGQHNGLMPQAASEEAPWVDGLFNTMMTIATGLFLLVQGIIIISVFKYRRRPGDETDGPPIEGNIPLEILWTAIPATIVLGLGIYSFEVYNSMGGLDPMASHDPKTMHAEVRHSGAAIAAPLPGATETPEASDAEQVALGVGASPGTQGRDADVSVNVLGLQFAWIFTYPDSGVTSGELHLPAGKEAKLTIAASDVIHALWIPQFRLKQDAIPGRDTELRFVPKDVGTYPVVCAELCGAYHGGMKAQVVVEEPEVFEAWLQSQIAAQQSGDDRAIALNTDSLSEAEYLQPYADEIGVNAQGLGQLHPPQAEGSHKIHHHI